MTTYQEFEVQFVDSPLNQMDEDSYWWNDLGLYDPRDPMKSVQQRMVLILSIAIIFVLAVGYWVFQSDNTATAEANAATESEQAMAPVQQPAVGGISPFFTREVQHWAPQIVAWSAEFGLDPNLVATVMQIESCGDPNAVSSAGAQGLFQVMPFHFTEGETMQDPDTNARRGLAYLALGMQQTGGDAGLSFAGYNGGHGTAARGWDSWPAETQRYYVWSTGIYGDAASGSATSETLNEWLAAGGGGLCNQAASRLGLQ